MGENNARGVIRLVTIYSISCIFMQSSKNINRHFSRAQSTDVTQRTGRSTILALFHWNFNSKENRQTYRHTDRQTDRQRERLTGWKTPWVTVLSIVERTVPSRSWSTRLSGCSMTIFRSRQLIQRVNTFCWTSALHMVNSTNLPTMTDNHEPSLTCLVFCLL